MRLILALFTVLLLALARADDGDKITVTEISEEEETYVVTETGATIDVTGNEHVESFCSYYYNMAATDIPPGKEDIWAKCMVGKNTIAEGVIAGSAKVSSEGKREEPPPGSRRAQAQDAIKKMKESADRLRKAREEGNSPLDKLREKRKNVEEKIAHDKEQTKQRAQNATNPIRERVTRLAKKRTETMKLRDTILGEHKQFREEYVRTGNFTQYKIDEYEWRVRWNDSFPIIFPNGKWHVSIEQLKNNTESGTLTIGHHVVNQTAEIILERVNRLKSNATREYIMAQIKNHTAWHINHRTGINGGSGALTPTERLEISKKFKYDTHPRIMKRMAKILNTARRKQFLHEQREKRRRDERALRTAHYPNLLRKSANVFNATRHKERAKHAYYNNKHAHGHFMASAAVKKMMKRNANWKMTAAELTKKWGIVDAEEYWKKFNGTKGNSNSTTFMRLYNTLMPKELHARHQKSAENINRLMYNRTAWTHVSDSIAKFAEAAKARLPKVHEAIAHGGSMRHMKPETHRFFTFQGHNTAYGPSEIEVDGDRFMVPKKTPLISTLLNVNDTIASIEDALDSFFSCRTNLTAGGPYCFPFIDPLIGLIPNLPDVLNITDRIPIDCDAYLIHVHGSIGILDGYFQRLGNLFRAIFTIVPGFGALGFPEGDERRDLYPEIYVCGIPELILFVFFLFVLVLIAPMIGQLFTDSDNIAFQQEVREELAAIKAQVGDHHPDIYINAE